MLLVQSQHSALPATVPRKANRYALRGGVASKPSSPGLDGWQERQGLAFGPRGARRGGCLCHSSALSSRALAGSALLAAACVLRCAKEVKDPIPTKTTFSAFYASREFAEPAPSKNSSDVESPDVQHYTSLAVTGGRRSRLGQSGPKSHHSLPSGRRPRPP